MIHLPQRMLLALVLAVYGIMTSVAHAQVYGLPAPSVDPEAWPSLAEFRALQQRLIAAEQRLDTLSQQQTEFVSLPAPPSDATIEQRLKDLELKTSTPPQPPSPTFPNLKMSGFFHLDAGHFNQDAVNRANLGDIQDGVGFRRARLAAAGSVTDFTSYFLEMDFGIAGRPSFTDVWGEQSQLPFFGNIRIGQFRMPLSMDAWTPIKQLDFLERSLPFQAFDPFRKVGIMAYDTSEDEYTTWAYSVFRSGGYLNQPLGDTRYGTDIGDNGGVGVMGRATHLLYYDEPSDGRYLTHIGGGYSFSELTGSTGPNSNIYESRPIPEFFLGDASAAVPNQTVNGTPAFPDTGRLLAQNFHVLNAQLAGQAGSFHWQSEYFGTVVNQIYGPAVYYDGFYVQAGYFLTGEHRTYNKKYGVFDKVVPFTEFFGTGRHGKICGWGAWEVTSRLSYVNLNDPDAVAVGPFVAGPPATPDPGRMYETTLGMNWFWNQYTTVQFDWMHCFLDTVSFGNSDLDIFAARLQVQF